MKYELKTSIEIISNKETIWNVLTDFEAYPKWNPFIKSITGLNKVNSTFNAHIQDMKFNPKLLVFEKEKELRWIGKLFVKGIFDGEHIFKINEKEDGICEFIQNEKFSGILVGPFKKKLKTDTLKGFQEMNQKLKERCEIITLTT